MRALVVLTVVMGVLIVAGTVTVGVTIFHRVGGATSSVTGGALGEPAGTHIAQVSAYGEKLAIVLQGGGPDRIVIFDPAKGRILAHILVSH